MIDFTSSLYLGLEHSSDSLAAWPRLTLGKPAALEAPPGSREVERELATVVGCERALLAPSTLHIFSDLLAMFAGRRARILLEESAYPIVRLAAGYAARPETFGVACGQPLAGILQQSDRRPAIVTDGFIPSSGAPAPLQEFARRARDAGGWLIVDDTQALGIFGTPSRSAVPYGEGGGGSLRWTGVGGDHVIVVASLAKAFGAPLAMIGGSEAMLDRFERSSSTRVHCSPPSVAATRAAAVALGTNRREGEWLRRRLAKRVCRLRRGLRNLGLDGPDSLFPVQPVTNAFGADAHHLFTGLLESGIRTVLARPSGAGSAQVVFIVTARHRLDEIDRALEALAHLMSGRFKSAVGENRGRRYR